MLGDWQARLEKQWPQLLWCSLVTALALNVAYLLWPQAPETVVIRPDPRTLRPVATDSIPYLTEAPTAAGVAMLLVAPQAQGADSVQPVHSRVSGSKKRVSGTKSTFTGVVHLNQAGLEQLQLLPGIGPKTAQGILSYRQQHGAFRAVSDLLAVDGIGPKKLEKLSPHCQL